MGLTQLIETEMRRGEAGLNSPVGHAGAAAGRDRSDGPSHVAFSHLARALASGLLAFRLFRVLALMHAIWDA